ncbi:MAG: zinc ribbon domain-containing protein [Ruminococcaceae bacterium]|nr:zinc ribbon domain-containing protein [Oscillospiraceae bacterium]
MKQCPRCKATVQENARFCLYCMAPFEEKTPVGTQRRRSWWWIGAALLGAVAMIAVTLWLLWPQDGPGLPVASSAVSEEKETNPDSAPVTTPDHKETATIGGGTTGTTAGGTTGTTAGGTTGTTAGGTTGTTTAKPTTTTTTAKPTTTTTTKAVVPSFTYVTATQQNTYPNQQMAPGAPSDAIVITKVHHVAPDGNYVIPDRVDGYKVAAIMPGAFSDPAVSAAVRSVTLPATVRALWEDSLSACYGLTDLYVRSGSIDILDDALPPVAKRTGTLTIHCARDCKNSDFYYYRNIAGQYGARYQEWNG